MSSFRSLVTIGALTLGLTAMSQLLVYKTYDDLVNKTPTKTYDKAVFKKWKGDENSVVIFDRGGKDELELECANIWGFKYQDATYRISRDSKYFVKKSGPQIGIPCVIVHLSDIVMYENGLSYLDATKSKHGQAYVKGMCASISKDLNSDMAALPCYPAKWVDEQVLDLVGAYPELSDLSGDLKALQASYGPMSGGAFSREQMRTYLRDYEENKKKKASGQ